MYMLRNPSMKLLCMKIQDSTVIKPFMLGEYNLDQQNYIQMAFRSQ